MYTIRVVLRDVVDWNEFHDTSSVVIAEYLNVICWFRFYGNHGHVYAYWLNLLYFGQLFTDLGYKTSEGISMDLSLALRIHHSSCIGFQCFVRNVIVFQTML